MPGKSSLWCAGRSLALVSLLFAVQLTPVQAGVVISQIYGGGGNVGAPYTHDFIELFNNDLSSHSLSGWSVQYATATGTGNFGATASQLTLLPAITLVPGQYLLIQGAAGPGGTTPLPTPDVADASPIALSATAGKVALVNSTGSLGCNGGSNPCSAAQLALILDLVGYGNANFFEGLGPAPTLSNTTAALRLGGGQVDTDNNAADFIAAAPAPRNTASPLNPPVVNRVSAPGTWSLMLGALLLLGLQRAFAIHVTRRRAHARALCRLPPG
jgi:uncharacterized protein